ncbi:MAG: MbnP family protein, partial [Bacteroidota bacterium]
MKSLLSILTLAFTLTAFSQTPVNLNIYHKLGSTDFAFNQASQNNMSNGNFKLTRMEYYMTKFTIIHDGGMMTTVPDNVVALVSADEQTSIALGSFNVTNIEGIKFHIGVHTPVNHNDPSLQANGSPLAFQNPSMHWGWTSGYRFIALEGKTGTSMNQTTELHGLGDINYLETTVTALGSLYNGEYFININADYNRALEDIDISSGIIVHGEDQQAATMIQNFKNYVFSSSNSLAKVNPLVEANINLYP